MQRRILIAVGALVLLLLGAYLMSEGEPRVEIPRTIAFPTAPRTEDLARRERRARPLPTQSSSPSNVPADPSPSPLRRDPFLSALPPLEKSGAVFVLEANALRYSEIGEMVLRCLSPGDRRSLDEVKEALGVDPLEDLDRVAMAGPTLMLSGSFAGLKQRLGEGEARGSRARIYQRDGTEFGVVDDDLVVVSRDRAELEEALDRAISPDPQAAPALDESEAYGEGYGALSAAGVEKLLLAAQPKLAGKLAGLSDRVGFHLDADHDLAMVLDVTGNDAEKVGELSRAAAGAVALWRVKAQAGGDKELAALLDFAKVHPQGNQSRLELAVPYEWLKSQLGSCADLAAADPGGAAPVQAPADREHPKRAGDPKAERQTP